MKNIFFRGIAIFALVSMTGAAFGQVELSKETTKEKKAKEKKEKTEKKKDNATSVFLTANWSSTNRKLIENDGLFGKPLGEREFEKSSNAWSFELGFRNKIHKNISWEGGISLMQNAESYLFEGADSTYSYKTKYMYIAMPVKLYYTYGESFKLLAGGGIVPQMFLGYKQDIEYTNSLDETTTEEVKLKSGYSPFVISAVVNIGTQIKLGGNWSFLFVPEYKIQLTTSNEKNSAYKHYGRSLGFNFGLILDL
jgi:hypothetical protein